MPSMHAEDAYLFRHALLRDGGYDLQTPSQRRALHLLAAEIIESIADTSGENLLRSMASEICDHLRASRGDGSSSETLEMERRYTFMAAEYELERFQLSRALRYWRELADIEEGRPKGHALRMVGSHAQYIGTGENALDCLQEALAIAQQCQEPVDEAKVWNALGTHHMIAGDADAAESAYRRSLYLLEQTGVIELQITAHLNLAVLLGDTGRFEYARDGYKLALDLAQRHEFKLGHARAQLNLGSLLQEHELYAEARERIEAACALYEELGDLRGLGIAYGNLAIICAETHDALKAERMYGQARQLCVQTGNRIGYGTWTGNLANLHLQSGREESAERYYLEALDVHRDGGNVRMEGVTLGNLGSLRKRQGRLEEAERCIRAALQIHASLKNERSHALALGTLGLVLQERGKTQEGEVEFAKAVEALDALNLRNQAAQLRGEESELRNALGLPPR